MTQETRNYIIGKSHELMEAVTCSKEAKAAAESWLAAAGTEREAEETEKYIAELEEDIVTVDALIALAESETGAKIFGDGAKGVADHGREIKQYAQENGIECYISLEERMACGIGACLACVCQSKEIDDHSHVHNKRICKDGPVFLAAEVEI